MQYTVIIEKENKSYGAYVPDLPGCVAIAESESEVIELIREAIELHLESILEDSLPIPQPKSKSLVLEVN
jgi:predicted RNase H-like HicB family nuclease